MARTVIATADAPAAIGPYSQAIRVGAMVFTSGQIPLDPATGQMVTGDIAVETRRVLDNLAAVLTAEALVASGPEGSRRLLGRGRQRAVLVDAMAARARLAEPRRPLVRRRQDQHHGTTASIATSTAHARTRPRSSVRGRARRHPRPHLRRAPPRGVPGRQRAERPGRRAGRPGRDLHADDPRGRRSRCSPAPASGAPHSVVFGGFSAEALPTASTTPGQARHHRRRRLAPRREDRAAQGQRRRALTHATARRSSTCSSSAHRQDIDWRPTAATAGGTTDERASPTPRRAGPRQPSTRCSSSTPRGTTGKPKGIFHTTGGYLTQAATT
jgi:hypothetical protein